MNKELVSLILITLTILVVSFITGFSFIDPSPPKKISFAVGSKEGAYYQQALKYQQLLSKDGVAVDIIETEGSQAILDKLKNNSEIDAAFIQGGISDPELELYSLASVFYEPLWIFYHGEKIDRLSQLKNKKIALGPEGSGTGIIAEEFLKLNNINADNSEFFFQTNTESIDALKSKTIDAACFVISPESALIKELFTLKGLKLFSFNRKAAYQSRFRYVADTILYEGMVDLALNIPAEDVSLLAPVTNLVVRKELNPAIVYLLIKAAHKIHYKGGFLEAYGSFPSAEFLTFPHSPEAEEFLKNGPSFIYKIFPFWIAVLLNRLKFLLLPLITLCYPLFKMLPPVYQWRIKSKIKKSYQNLSVLEKEMLNTEYDKKKMESALKNLEDKIKQINVPASYANELYQLQLHFDYVQNNFKKDL